MDDKLKKDVEALVAEIFSQKEDAKKRERTEDALQKSAETIAELTTTLEERNADVEKANTQIEELEGKNDDLNSELEAAKTEIEESTEKLAETEKMIEEMKKDKAAELRMSELTEAGVALSDKDAQTAKVREMDDESFTAYKEELMSLRQAVEAELAKADEKPASEEEAEETADAEETVETDEETAEETDEEVAEEEESEEASEEEAEEETPPAQVDPEAAAQAALNLEVMPSDDILAKYDEMGKAMAKRMTTNDE